MPKEIVGKRVAACKDVGICRECEDCEFVAIANTEDEVINRLVAHLKSEHNTVIPPGSHLDNVLRRFVKLLCAM